MNMPRRDFVGENPLDMPLQDSEATIRFAIDSGITVTIAVDDRGAPASREDVLVKARDAVKQLAAAFDEVDAARRRNGAHRGVEDAGELFRSWAYR